MAGIAQGDGNLQWTEEQLQTERDALTNVQPTNSFPFNILLLGMVGAGKSSFINTVFAALTGKIEDLAFTAKGDESITTSFSRYPLQDKCPVVLFDTMGLEQDTERSGLRGLCVPDVEYILDGHIKVGYEFKANEPIALDSPYFNTKPEEKDTVQVVVLVVEAPSIRNFAHDISLKVKEVFKQANKRKIRWTVVMTQIDKACKDVSEDITTIFSSEIIEDLVAAVDERFGAKAANVFLVQNYVSQSELSLPMNILALRTLNGISSLAALTLKSQSQSQLMVSPWRNENNLTEQAVHEMRSCLIKTLQENVINIRLCYMGPSSGGKSDFINSILSEFVGHITALAETGSLADTPTTTYYEEYQPRQVKGSRGLNIELIDTMGFLADIGGMLADDIPAVLDGKVSNMTEFSPSTPLPEPNSSSPARSMHLLALVVDGSKFASYPEELITNMKSAIDCAKHPTRKIPRVVLVTHADKVCKHVAQNPAAVYRSQQLKQCIENVQQKLQIPPLDILPICNYYNDTELDWRKSALVLQALAHQVKQIQDHFGPMTSPGQSAKKKGWFSWWF